MGHAFYNYCQRSGLEGLDKYEGEEFGVRQFVIEDFAVVAEPKSIHLTNITEENATEPDFSIPINLKNTDVFAEFERVVAQIKEIVKD